ncbi:MAG TPA: formate dehydrogenase subunit gamma [Burkholderiales bacterium]|nr:formate dehydrogenase subunit gamma [Burkholderiales bacterium]
MTRLGKLFGALLAIAACTLSGSAFAQQQAGDSAKAQAEQRVTQPGNNAPVWRDVKSGEPNYTSLPGREMGVLIQPQLKFPGQSAFATAGEAWRNFRNGPLVFYGGWAVIIAALGVLAFYLVKGALKLKDKPTGRLIERFNGVERIAHWWVAISFVVLALSGLTILFGKFVLLPVLGYTLFAWLTALAKNLHNFVGPLFILGLLLMFVVYVKDNFWSAGDGAWIAKAGGLLSGEDVPSGRFNFGEKGWFWAGVVVLGIIMSVTGLILLFPNFDQLRTTMQQANVFHIIGAVAFVVLSFGHIYLGTIGVEGAYQGMRTGYVDETWAKEHHELWYRDVKSGKVKAKAGGSTAGAPQAQH